MNSDQGITHFKQKKILRSTSHKNVQKKKKKKKKDFFTRLLLAWLHLTNNNFPALCL